MTALLVIILALVLGGTKLLMLVAWIYGVVVACRAHLVLGVLALLIPPVAIVMAVIGLFGGAR